MRRLICMSCCLTALACSSRAQVKEPYRPLHGGSYSNAPVKGSPDPLITYRWDDPKAADSLQIYTLQPQKITAVPEASFKQDGNGITVLGKGDLMFDFGVESAGWLEFDSDDLPDSVEASISEYNEPEIVNRGVEHPSKTSVPLRYGHTWRLELNRELYEGVRFAWIHVKTFSKPWHIRNVRLVCQIKPVNYNGSFSCSDTMLTRIWYTGAYTVKLNIQQDYFGAVLEDRSDRYSWTGDAYPSQAAALAAFGNDDMVRKNLLYTSRESNGIPAYSLYWVLSLVDYFNYTGDSAFLKACAAGADTILMNAYNGYGHLPPLSFMGWDERLGAGFESPQNPESESTYRMLCIDAWRQFANAMLSIHDTGRAEKYQAFASEKIRQLQGEKDSIRRFGIHAVSEAVDAGLGDNAAIRRQSVILFADRLNRLSYSPFNQYFIIQAMALAGRYEDALATIDDCWGGQIRYGGTTFFEIYRPSWNAILKPNDPVPNDECGYTSLAHPWGAGVTKWLSENILGIRPVQPGFGSFAIIPHLNGKLTWVKGGVPTPYGIISAGFDTRSGSCAVSIPEGTEAAEIALPKAGRQIQKVTVNGRLLKDGVVLHRQAGIGGIREDGRYIYLTGVKAGNYAIQIAYTGAGRSVTVPEGQFNYLITEVKQDSLASGDWPGRYGKEGYMLFGYPADVASKRLPAYVDTVALKKDGVVVWDSLSDDPRVLAAPAGTKKRASAAITRDPAAGYQTMSIDIRLKKDHPYRVSLYFLDLDKQHRRSAMEIFDLKTLNIIAPVQMIRHYESGRYVSFSFDRSVRIRINQVRGKNAAVSGIFFDKP